jgi:hypothetical protein
MEHAVRRNIQTEYDLFAVRPEILVVACLSLTASDRVYRITNERHRRTVIGLKQW